MSIVRREDIGPRPTGNVPKDIHVRQYPPTDPEENKITDPNFQREFPTDANLNGTKKTNTRCDHLPRTYL